jgi:hypothetical protein
MQIRDALKDTTKLERIGFVMEVVSCAKRHQIVTQDA